MEAEAKASYYSCQGRHKSRDEEANKQAITRSRERISLVGAEGNKETASRDLG